MDHRKIRYLTQSGVFAALIFIATAYLHVNTNAGYTHFGDGLIFLAASVLPAPYAAAAAAVGAGLADAVSMPIWMAATIPIKILTALCFSSKTKKIICRRNLLALIPSLLICVVGYSLFEAFFMLDGFGKAALVKAFASAPAYCIQIAGSSAVFIAFGRALDSIRLGTAIKDQ